MAVSRRDHTSYVHRARKPFIRGIAAMIARFICGVHPRPDPRHIDRLALIIPCYDRAVWTTLLTFVVALSTQSFDTGGMCRVCLVAAAAADFRCDMLELPCAMATHSAFRASLTTTWTIPPRD
ncbi:protein scp/tpx-1/ag5/pr-1/sc7 domain-containing protein [Anopheles sinensis]|uniref:Protein scp/tpx-1/ag5/pr-1/sc7 domain-containing protein n=1 Tax=Anopheles sinensis TaxID=74873 RepID=A0A084VXN0_ANOSI|nr:protein scp/tpx-1/ag5/pr-1/sc7 domain-containing protein [Anopheles sinensis]